jgi:hypothetical protein
LPACTEIGDRAFGSCTGLTSVYLTGVSSVPTLGSSVFSYAGNFEVFVPESLYYSFLSAARWTFIASRIRSV